MIKFIKDLYKIKVCAMFLLFLAGCTSNKEININTLSEIYKQVDSLNQVLESAYYCRDDTFRQSDSLLQFSKKLNYKKGEIEALGNVARHHIRNNRTKEIVLLYDTYQQTIAETRPDEVKAALLCKLGKMALNLQNWSAALDHALHAEKICKASNDERNLIEALALQGQLYGMTRINTDKSMACLRASLDLSLKIGFERGISRAYNNIGNLYKSESNFEEALSYYKKASAINERMGFTDYQTINYGMIASVLCADERCHEAEALYDKSYEIAEKVNDRKSQILAVRNSFSLLKSMGRAEEALERLIQARDTAKFYHLHRLLRLCSQTLYEHYMEKNNDKLALENYMAYKNAEDSLALKKNALAILKTELQYGREQDQIAEEKDKLQFKFLLFFLVAFLSFVAYTAYQKYKQKISEIANKQKENKLLKEKLELKNKELTSNIVHQIRLSENRKQIADYLKEEKKKFSASYYPILDKIIAKLSNGNQEQVWSEFEFHFNQIHQSFFQILSAKFPNITINEKRLCAFLVMNMNTREISALTGQSERAIHQARTRLRNKIGIKGKNISISNFLAGLNLEN